MDKEQLLYHYFSKTLTAEQEEEFNALLSSDTEFKEQFNFEQSLQQAIQNKKSTELKETLKSFEKEVALKSKRIVKRNYQKWIMAASIVLLVGIGWLTYKNSFAINYEVLYDVNFQQYPNTVFAITRGDTTNSLERNAFTAYELGDFEKAILEFEKIDSKDRKEYVTFYKAQSYLNLGKNKEAKELFKKIINKNTLFVGESHWYLALTYLHSNEIKAAKKELQILRKDYTYKKESALELLKQLD